MRNVSNHSGTSDFSSSDILIAPERRGHERQITILRLAKLKSHRSEGWGFIKNLSASGMMLEVNSNFGLGETVQIFLSDDNQLLGNVKWRRNDLVGIQFDQAIDTSEVLRIPPTTKSGKTPRLPRVSMRLPIKIRLGCLSIDADIFDVSPAGMCIKSDHVFELGKHITIMLPELADINGTVRWQSRGRVGIAFHERLSIDNLMNWLSTYYNSPMATNIESPAPDTNEPASSVTEFHVLGHDELGRKIPIAVLQSASLALLNFRATSKFFQRVSITNELGVELSLTAVRMLCQEEKQIFDPQINTSFQH
jgi:hypothetical protein